MSFYKNEKNRLNIYSHSRWSLTNSNNILGADKPILYIRDSKDNNNNKKTRSVVIQHLRHQLVKISKSKELEDQWWLMGNKVNFSQTVSTLIPVQPGLF